LAVCSVLRCEQETAGRFTTNENVFMETAVCGDHLQRLEAGEPWAYQGMSNELLMDSDLPPVVVHFKLSEGIGPGVTLALSTDGDENPHYFWISREHAAQLGSFLSHKVPEGLEATKPSRAPVAETEDDDYSARGEDDDSGYGPDSYYARSMGKDD
jgi:hypothetical protein